ncbi:hypothetical protein [Paraburkholderia sp. RAU2J]|uniref:hypothetical protein n=1 Tax=Paraburkholderia sp. RAU2J TaxID=1938810 RepID=UPI0011C3C092|nr:hypothetical protein [Paraburkholderia sp. RAU2J]
MNQQLLSWSDTEKNVTALQVCLISSNGTASWRSFMGGAASLRSATNPHATKRLRAFPAGLSAGSFTPSVYNFDRSFM